MANNSDSTLQAIQQQLDQCLSSDRGRLLAGLGRARQRVRRKQPVDRDLQKLSELLERSKQAVEQRRAGLPPVTYPDLPVCSRREEIATAIRDHQVVVIAGETGSGKTTQLPKICLELGRGSHGLIGHTQPRRIAARTVASRIAEELNTSLGEKVGYQVRFNDHSGDRTYVKLMTDGILLAEIQNDRYLNRYDTLIIDEAHERSLNIDFLLGYLKQILPKRPDLKIIITSATIDVERFSRHFNDAPVIEVSGRTYPVEVRYRPPQEGTGDLPEQVLSALQELLELPQRGDVLVFLSGERDIRELALALRKAVTQKQLPTVDVLPLYARLSLAEQNRVFQANTRKGIRIVLATNVAETSVTVPGIRYVIDPGTARISRYSYRTKVQRLPIEAVSQASANQRKGRCGRLSDGVCIRLYSEDDFQQRPEFTDPEIVRTNLAAVILQMMHLRIGDIRDFEFVDAPDQRLISDGFNLLKELGAIDAKEQLTAVGRQLCRLPVDPRMGRMLLAAEQQQCLRELLIIASGLSIQDPRERPADKQQQADQAHARWRDKASDFISLLNLWDHLEQQRQNLSGNQFSKYCKANFVSYLRMREWRDLHHQLHQVVRELKLASSSARLPDSQQPADNPLIEYHQDTIHRALLTGLLGQVARIQEGKEYLGTRNRKFMIFPGSGVYKKTPKWLMCAELLETSKLFAHTVAAIDSQWLPQLAAHLVKKSHSEPHYDARRGEVMAYEKQTLYGLTIVERKRCRYGHIDPAVARQVFIQGALLEGGYQRNRRGKGAFVHHNRQLLEELEQLEARTRRRDIVAEEQVMFDFFDQRLPADINNLVAFEQWRKQAEREQPKFLYMDRELLMQRAVSDASQAQFPNEIECQGLKFPLSYHFEPGHPEDGVTVTIPLGLLHQVPKYRFQWLVPGMLRDKCIALVKSLPKPLRREFVPVPNAVDKVWSALKACNRPLVEVLGEQLQRHYDVDLSAAPWHQPEQQDQLDTYYRMNFRLLDDNGEPLAMGRDLQQLQRDYRGEVQTVIQQTAAPDFERNELRRWDFGELPEVYEPDTGSVAIRAWPALVDNGDSVALKLLDHPETARNTTWQGLLRLALLEHSQTAKYLGKQLLKGADLKLLAAGLPKRQQMIGGLIMGAYRQALFDDKEIPRCRDDFVTLLERGTGNIVSCANELEAMLLSLLAPLAEIRKGLKKVSLGAFDGVADVNDQLGRLFADDFWVQQPYDLLIQYPRYIKALGYRVEKMALNSSKDRQYSLQLQNLYQRLSDLPMEPVEWTQDQQLAVAHYRYMLEEYRVSLFAQQLRTALPVSEKRLETQWKQVLEQFS
ncbi:ATP-dependent RNA helicase HrpA [bacterium SCSIO 12696]|nr:ATP-dependent RNA helicase HrpA [bacterium SCSIO 12696]